MGGGEFGEPVREESSLGKSVLLNHLQASSVIAEFWCVEWVKK